MAESNKDDDGRCNPLNVMDSIPRFTGDDMTYSSTRWTQDLEDNADIFEWSQQQKLIIARRCLAGTAGLWLRTEKAFKSYDELKAALLKEFPESVNTKQMHEIMSQRKKQPNETYYQYMLVMKELGKRAKFPDYVSIQYIVDGISDYESNKLLFYGVTSYAALKEKLALYETFKQKTKNQDVTRQRDRTAKSVKTVEKTNAGIQQRCYRCGDIGHLSSSCQKGLKCFKCNEFGHIGVNCKKVESSALERDPRKSYYNSGVGAKQDRRSMVVQYQTSGGAADVNEWEQNEQTNEEVKERDEPASSGESGDESGSEPESPSEKLAQMQTYNKDWTSLDDVERDMNNREPTNENVASTSASNQDGESSKPNNQPALRKILPKLEMPGGAMLYHTGVLAGVGLDGLGTHLGLGNLAMGYPQGFILGVANQGQEGASSSSSQPQFITIPLSMAMAAANPANGCPSASSDDSSELQDLSTGGRK